MTTNQPGIGELQTLPTAELHTHHRNPRKGDVGAIASSLATNGQFRPIVVNKGTHTGRPMEVLAGNHTLEAARQLAEQHPEDERWQSIDAYIVDVDEDRATKIVLADNRTQDKGGYDDSLLLELLEACDFDLEGTGYDEEDLEDLSALVEEETYKAEEAAAIAQPQVPIETDPSGPSGGVSTAAEGETSTGEDLIPSQPSNVGETRGSTAAAPGYADRTTRMMILHYPLEQFVWINEALEKWHNDHPEANGANAVALLTFMEEYTGESAPEEE